MPRFDIIFVLPYPFSDHPSFPEGLLKNALERAGFRVGVIAAPFWQKREAFTVLGKPGLFFALISGPVDSVVLNYTSLRKRRREDLYQFEGQGFFKGYPLSIKYKIRPDRTLAVFANRIKESYRDVPLIIGGVEASQRRFAHYDFQQERLRRSILMDTRADLLVTGMGEKQIVRIARAGRERSQLSLLEYPGTARVIPSLPPGDDLLVLPSFEDIQADPSLLLTAQQLVERANVLDKRVVQRQGDRYVLQEPSERYSIQDLTGIYDHPYTRIHPGDRRFTPALRMNLFSITSHRGCGGGCSFCSIGQHEGRRILSRPPDSILREIRTLIPHPEWKGIVSDIGGATADMYGNDCHKEHCSRHSCLFPTPCPRGFTGRRFLDLLREARKVKGVRKVFVGSGMRYDLLLSEPELLEEVLVHHSGRFLRIAPEHTQDRVLALMGKPPFEKLVSFVRLFNEINRGLKRKIELAPYFIVGHPGETAKDVLEMRDRIRGLGLGASGVQIFTPTPGTLSTAMYHAGLSPKRVPLPVEKGLRELAHRKALLTG